MEERDNTPMLDLNVSLDETMLDNGLDCVPHCDAEKIDGHILYDNGDLVETSKDMTTDYIPKVEMLFESEDELYHFYNYYARRTGFSIRKGHFKVMVKLGKDYVMWVVQGLASRRKNYTKLFGDIL
ncbi:hypothetical protein MKW98_029232 [Papaver atlanticum]|uniref:FAR1 domain-containing protein n=1 Tax=Papaver atlanticum TaxID=357466 RepID=A0AAD4T2P2_9MAGN|nr:hypothetical protein MKW98_029232 [Papaver atlanticum]